ncbi:Collectin-12 Collectin-3 [Triplophysa tibetana]|uniref:Collectin-12 Collectin-3 n=1 Tax=Triplophysa tibetana TaxID=1572043 RepID=A0A5A9N446_9TELE|nr:Collectin-12 Collectin-3 [Triplophysa tibetana]
MENTEDGKEMNIYANRDEINRLDVCRATEDTRKNQTFQHTGSETVRNRSHRSVVVCLVVLCVLLLTAVIVLCVLIYTNNQQFHINQKNITEERDQLLTNNILLEEENDQLITKYINITEEKDQLQNKYIKLTEERDQKDFKYINMIKEKEGLLSNNDNLNKQKEQLTQQINKLKSILSETDGWIYYQSSFYLISSEKKTWSESRRNCRERGADLTIINNKEEQDFVKKHSCSEKIWIGLTDSEVEGRWKWVDGNTPTSSFWGSAEPNGQGRENCVLTDSSVWADFPCNEAFKWICEKKITNVK